MIQDIKPDSETANHWFEVKSNCEKRSLKFKIIYQKVQIHKPLIWDSYIKNMSECHNSEILSQPFKTICNST